MEKIEAQIHLRNIVSCLNEISDYSHYLSYERYLLDKELKKIINSNLSLAAHEAKSLYTQGCEIEGLKYLAGLANSPSLEEESYAVYSLLQNDIDYMNERVKEAFSKLQEDVENISIISAA